MTQAGDSALSNWGRWGENDQLGTLNLMTAETVKNAAGLIRSGKVYSLGMPVGKEAPLWPLRHPTWKVTVHHNPPLGKGSADDVITLHSHSSTHMDALCHIWYDGVLYNGYAAAENVTSQGATRNSIDNVPAIVGRAVLLDIARRKGVDHLDIGERITTGDLADCARSTNVEIRAGDIVLIRTGWIRVFATDPGLFNAGEPGIDESTLAWFHEHDVMAIGADQNGVECMEKVPPEDIPVHRKAIRDLGIYLLENLYLEELAADGVKECFLTVAPLRISTGVGSPINPIAVA